jgi:hypothetical protein
MPGLNPSGTANTEDYNVGRGKVYAAELDANGIPLGYRFLGNAPEFNISMETETLEHQSSTGGLKVTDKEVVISQKVNLALTLDEINFENMALFFSGATATHDNSSVAAGLIAVDNVVVVEQGRWYDLYTDLAGVPTADSSSQRIYDTGAFTVTHSDASVGVLGVDYLEDRKMGRIFIIDGSLTLTAGSIDVVVAASVGAVAGVDEVRALTQTSPTFALKFISENPAAGDAETEYQFHQVALKAEGDFGLISDEFTSMGLNGVAERNETAGGVASPTLTIRTHAAA